MSRIRSRDTKPELAVRSTLHRLGYRFRLHAASLTGKPDLVFPRLGKVILIHGCYWHGHTCRYGKAQSKSNLDFWRTKIRTNKARDAKTRKLLRKAGWQVLEIWECQIKRNAWLDRTQKFLESANSKRATSRTTLHRPLEKEGT